MQSTDKNVERTALHNPENYHIEDLDSEIAVDRLCSALLKQLHRYLLEEKHMAPLPAGSQAAGADYFLREFMIGKLRRNIFTARAEQVRQFGGNWYIISNLEPNMEELSTMLAGAASFFSYCAEHRLIEPADAEAAILACQQHDYFQQRIEDFHNICGAGYSDWDQACPLPR